MIAISEKTNCCGCGGCAQKCPRQCIIMEEDAEGFLYPKVNLSQCIDCGLCNAVCPIKSQEEKRQPIRIVAAKNPDNSIRKNSSSGGVFYLIAKSIIEKGGAVYGAEFDSDWSVRHNVVETKDGIARFMGSKYSQSKMGEMFKSAEKILQSGREVLFTGTPCQIAGLKKYLGKDYANLITVDVVCHGVPSPGVWRDYLCSLGPCSGDGIKKNAVFDASLIEGVFFRDKLKGWKRFALSVRFKSDVNPVFAEYHRDNLYMRGFLKNIYLRPSCYSCLFRNGKSGSDISLGDFWGVHEIMPEFDDDLGVSLVLVYSTKGNAMLESLSVDARDAEYKDALKGNPCIEHSVKPHPDREWFYKKYPKIGVAAIRKTIDRENPSFPKRMLNRMKRVASRLFSILNN